MFNTHGTEYDPEISFRAEPCLTHYLRGKFVMRHTRSRKYGKFLSSDKRHKCVDTGNTRMNIVSRVPSANGIYRKTVYVDIFFGKDRTEAVDRFSRTVENAPDDLFGKAYFHRLSFKLCPRIVQRKTYRSLKNLNDRFITDQLDDSAYFFRAVVKTYLADLLVADAANSLYYDERTVYPRKSFIFKLQLVSPHFEPKFSSMTAENASSISFFFVSKTDSSSSFISNFRRITESKTPVFIS